MTTLLFKENLDEYQNIVMLYRNPDGELYLGTTSYYNGRGQGNDYLSVLYKDAVREGDGLMLGWNELDEMNAGRLVPERNAETAVEDFLYAHGLPRSWRSVSYTEAKDYPEMESMHASNPLNNGEVRAYVIAKN